MDFSKLLHGFAKIDDTWISLRGYMDLSQLYHVFLDFGQKKNMGMVDQDFKAC